MKDSAAERVYLITAVFALETFTATNAVVTGFYNATLRTGRHGAIGLLEYIVETGSIVWTQFIEAFDGYLFHTFSVLQRLHVVKG